MMNYTIKQIAEKTGFSTYTLRYYENQKILPPISRDASGNRVYSQEDIGLLDTIRCLKNTGMPLNEIGVFVNLCIQGDSTLETRKQIVTGHKQVVEQKVSQLMSEMKKINEKAEYYAQACKDGTEMYLKEKCRLERLQCHNDDQK